MKGYLLLTCKIHSNSTTKSPSWASTQIPAPTTANSTLHQTNLQASASSSTTKVTSMKDISVMVSSRDHTWRRTVSGIQWRILNLNKVCCMIYNSLIISLLADMKSVGMRGWGLMELRNSRRNSRMKRSWRGYLSLINILRRYNRILIRCSLGLVWEICIA